MKNPKKTKKQPQKQSRAHAVVNSAWFKVIAFSFGLLGFLRIFVYGPAIHWYSCRYPVHLQPTTLTMNPAFDRLSYIDVSNRCDSTIYSVQFLVSYDNARFRFEDVSVYPEQIDRSLDAPDRDVNMNFDVTWFKVYDPQDCDMKHDKMLVRLFRLQAKETRRFRVLLKPSVPDNAGRAEFSFKTDSFARQVTDRFHYR